MFRFHNPEFLYLLVLLPFIIAGFLYMNIRKKKDVQKIGKLATVKLMMPEMSLKRSYLKFWLIFAAITLGIFMVARPQFGTKKDKVERKGIELVIAIDVSNSMLARDISPDRLSKAKQMLTRIIDERKDDKVAIVVFAGEAYVQLPMTSDNQSAKIFLESITPSLVPVQGTVIGNAINIGMNSFTSEKDIDKAMIIITDGENHDGNAVEMAARAAEHNVMVNVVGIGSLEGVPIPMSQYSNENKKDNEGNIVVTKLNEQMCKEIAEAGKGLYVRADNTNNALKSLQAHLEKLQKKEYEGFAYSEYDEKFHLFAWVILVLLLLEICIFDKKNRIFRNVRIFK
ncbi:VWA domain-containing protein [Dysgonomonas sp. 216]|uniref:vWA domain-containing protein n=1 Tax=Dysgonomonas sp. 216 TaxID=2302934 RepID=UPI0013CFA008|nr:VWA domain-containing protein [Dysgonomonas sp. 216]NDW17331.1 VWA domain-containing protein [Dysgonomonas sp. 216]